MTDLHGAVEELLLSHRALIEEALYPLHEHAQLDEILQVFQHCILELQQREPAFWQLRVVEHIQHVIKSQVGKKILKRNRRGGPQQQQESGDGSTDPTLAYEVDSEPIEQLTEREQAVAEVKAETFAFTEHASAAEQIYRAVQDELLRLSSLLDDAARGKAEPHSHFLEFFWSQLEETMRENGEQFEHNGYEGEALDDAVSYTFEAISFDDLNDECGSANSGPSFEDIPSITVRLQQPDPTDRRLALDDLLEIPILEIVHCGANFKGLCSAVVGLFLQTDQSNSDVKAKKLIYELLNHIEDALLFLDVYWSVLEFAGKHYESGDLSFEKKNVQTTSDGAITSGIDVYRLLLVLMTRISRHWIHFSSETLAKVFFSTLQLLILSPTSCTENAGMRLIRPIKAISLLDSNANWFKAWIYKAPASDQLFAALQESGFIAELLQYLSRVRPLERLKSSNPVADEVERLTTQHILSIVSQLSEFYDSRRLLCSWQRISAHLQLKNRQVHWAAPDQIEMECRDDENDRVYHLANRVPTENLNDSKDEADDAERLGDKVIDAVVMSVIAVAFTDQSLTAKGEWPSCLFSSVLKYLPHLSALESAVEAILNLIERSFQPFQVMSSLPTTRKRAEVECENPWFPFRRSVDIKRVQDLIADSINVRVHSGELDVAHVRWCGQLLLNMILQLSSSNDDFRLSRNLQMKRLQLSRDAIQAMTLSRSAEGPSRDLEVPERRFLSNLGKLLRNSEVCRLSQQFRILQELAILYTIGLSRNIGDLCCNILELMVTISWQASAMRDISQCGMSEPCIQHLLKKWGGGDQRESTQREVLRFLVLPKISALFFTSDVIQAIIGDVTSRLLSSLTFTLAVNSSPDECPREVGQQISDLVFLRCCLSTQHSCESLLEHGADQNLILNFIMHTLVDHGEKCSATCDTEDLCTVAFELVLAMVSSVPAALGYVSVLTESKLIVLLNKGNPERRQEDCIISSCSLLQSQFQHTFEVVGGPSERLQRCMLYEFDPSVSGWSRQSEIMLEALSNTEIKEEVTLFVQTLLEKMMLSVEDSCNRSVPLDFVMLSQASWELIHGIESAEDHPLSSAQFTKVFGKLMYHLVLTKRSRLDETAACTPHVQTFLQPSSEQEFPSDAQRKLVNQLYKNCCHRLGLKASPTLLHCVIKKFGRHALDSFPVSALMILDQLFNEKEISTFLNCCWSSRGGAFLWTSLSSDAPSDDDESGRVPVHFKVASAAELVLQREFPQLLQCIEQSHCNVLTLVLRWLGQCFWNYFDWNNIVLYLYLTVLHGPEFQVYVVVAVMKHLEVPLKELSCKYSTQSVASFLDLTERPIPGFRFSQWRNLFLRLRNEYHDEVLRVLSSTDEKLEEP